MKLGNLSIDKIYVNTTEIPKVYLGNTVVYEQSGPAPEIPDYLRFIVNSDGVIYWRQEGSMPAKTIEYSKDSGETWNEITSASGSSAPSFSVMSGDTVLFRGNNAQYATDKNVDVSFSGTTAEFDVEGNIMSLIYGDNFSGQTTLESAFTFHRLFQFCTGLTNAENLVLPATTLSDSCYRNMFRNCTHLRTVPALPATALTTTCYYFMYEGCSNLYIIPSDYLPATVLSVSGYGGMFSNCSQLETAPELPATTLATACYNKMFEKCTHLRTAPALPATALSDSCYRAMFSNCSQLETAPELPATTLAAYCYYFMFENCSSLNYIKCLATDMSASNCTGSWVKGVSTFGTFVKAPTADWSSLTGTSGIPSRWTVEDAT